MKAKLFGTMWKKACNRLNRTREWATTNSPNYSTFASVNRIAVELDGSSPLVKDANNTSDVRNLGRDSLYSPLLKESAVARLLVEGRLPAPSSPIVIPKAEAAYSAPTEARLGILDPAESLYPGATASGMELGPEVTQRDKTNVFYVLQREITALKDLQGLKPSRVGDWKCEICPFKAQTPAILLSHYQYHLQLLSTPTPQPQLEAWSAYRQGRISESSAPMGTSQSTSNVGLRYSTQAQPPSFSAVSYNGSFTAEKLRQVSGSTNGSSQNSASGFLRSFVQAVMQNKQENGEQVSTSSIYEALTRGDKGEAKSGKDSISDGVPAKRPRLDDSIRQNVQPSNTAPSFEKDQGPIFDLPLDMSLGRSSIKQEPMEMVGFRAQNSHIICEASLVGSPSEVELGTSAPESGIFDMSESASVLSERKRTFETTQLEGSTIKCNGSFAPRKMLIARSRKTHMCRSSSMESISSLESTSFSSSVPPRSIGSLAGSPISEVPSDAESQLVQSKLALDMSSHCSMLVSAASPSSESDTSRTSSPTTQISRDVGGPLRTRCTFCNIQFGDEVMHSIHMGCHNHMEPFVCNICGKDCENKYGFYTHIMRGHSS